MAPDRSIAPATASASSPTVKGSRAAGADTVAGKIPRHDPVSCREGRHDPFPQDRRRAERRAEHDKGGVAGPAVSATAMEGAVMRGSSRASRTAAPSREAGVVRGVDERGDIEHRERASALGSPR